MIPLRAANICCLCGGNCGDRGVAVMAVHAPAMAQMAVHGPAMAQLGFDLKWLLKESKILIRQRVIKTASAFAPEASQPPEETPLPQVARTSLWFRGFLRL